MAIEIGATIFERIFDDINIARVVMMPGVMARARKLGDVYQACRRPS